jgi:hypothetical protein
MSSELAIATAEIVDILPPERRTKGNIEWVENSLKQGSPDEVLALCKQYLGVSNAQIVACKNEIAAQGIKLDRHIEYVDRKFQIYDREIADLKQKVAVQEAVGAERAQMQQFMIKGVMDSQNATNQAVVKAAKGGSDGGGLVSGALLFSGFFGFLALWAIAFAISYLGQLQAKPEAKQCGIDVECDIRPLQRPAPASNGFKGGV